ncbi:MAG TPA: LuxR C-terminal-related transcriptional regulator [Pseudonocardia sp.]|jgi:DNA-binding CsgD family transcriptional regulator/GAF domain-containing protein|nr:LuxR C-terminal-related transcriptional regulator [Pseudonocardia sp.]
MSQRAASRAKSLREADTGAPWVVTGHRLSPARLEETLELAGRAGGLLGWSTAPDADLLSDHHTARELLAGAWRESVDLIAGPPPLAADRLGELVGLLRELKAVDERVRDDLLARQSSAAQLVREALSQLREVDTVAGLVHRAPTAAASIGFDRAVLSQIDDSVWLPETAYVEGDPGWADEILRAGQLHPRILDRSLVETQIVRRNRPLVVDDLADRPDLNRAMVDTSMTRSYAAAPIVGWGRVIGFLHADCYHQRRNLDEMDRDLLWMFCEGLGTLITRAAALDELARLRGELGRLAAGTAPAGRGYHQGDTPGRATNRRAGGRPSTDGRPSADDRPGTDGRPGAERASRGEPVPGDRASNGRPPNGIPTPKRSQERHSGARDDARPSAGPDQADGPAGFTPRGAESLEAWFPSPATPFCLPQRFTDAREEGGIAADAALTRRELDVLRLMSGGRTNGQIARQLVIAEGTVKSHVKHILRKLDAANRAEAVSRWLRTDRSAPAAHLDYARSRVGAT